MRSGKFLRTALVLLLCLILLFPAGWGLSSDGGGGSYYFTYEQLGEEVQTLAAQYPDLVDVSVLGNSVEGRNIWSVTSRKRGKKGPDYRSPPRFGMDQRPGPSQDNRVLRPRLLPGRAGPGTTAPILPGQLFPDFSPHGQPRWGNLGSRRSRRLS